MVHFGLKESLVRVFRNFPLLGKSERSNEHAMAIKSQTTSFLWFTYLWLRTIFSGHGFARNKQNVFRYYSYRRNEHATYDFFSDPIMWSGGRVKFVNGCNPIENPFISAKLSQPGAIKKQMTLVRLVNDVFSNWNLVFGSDYLAWFIFRWSTGCGLEIFSRSIAICELLGCYWKTGHFLSFKDHKSISWRIRVWICLFESEITNKITKWLRILACLVCSLSSLRSFYQLTCNSVKYYWFGVGWISLGSLSGKEMTKIQITTRLFRPFIAIWINVLVSQEDRRQWAWFGGSTEIAGSLRQQKDVRKHRRRHVKKVHRSCLVKMDSRSLLICLVCVGSEGAVKLSSQCVFQSSNHGRLFLSSPNFRTIFWSFPLWPSKWKWNCSLQTWKKNHRIKDSHKFPAFRPNCQTNSQSHHSVQVGRKILLLVWSSLSTR